MFNRVAMMVALLLVLGGFAEAAKPRREIPPQAAPVRVADHLLPPQAAPVAFTVSDCRCGDSCPLGGSCVSCGCASAPVQVSTPAVRYVMQPQPVMYAQPVMQASPYQSAPVQGVSACAGGNCNAAPSPTFGFFRRR